MKRPADHQVIDLHCEQCGQSVPVLLGWLKAHSRMECACGHATPVHANDLVDAVKRADAIGARYADHA